MSLQLFVFLYSFIRSFVSRSLKHLISAWIVFDLGVYLTMHLFTRDWVWTPAIALELMEVIAFICLGYLKKKLE